MTKIKLIACQVILILVFAVATQAAAQAPPMSWESELSPHEIVIWQPVKRFFTKTHFCFILLNPNRESPIKTVVIGRRLEGPNWNDLEWYKYWILGKMHEFRLDRDKNKFVRVNSQNENG